jgi:regulator of RNase E activity RraA
VTATDREAIRQRYVKVDTATVKRVIVNPGDFVSADVNGAIVIGWGTSAQNSVAQTFADGK